MIEAQMLSQLLAPVSCAISIYFPVDHRQRDERAPTARLRGIVDTVAERIEQIDMKPDQRAAMLHKLRNFAENIDFARHRDPGLAIFAAPATAESEGFWVIPLPNAPGEMMVIGQDFHIKPLLPLIAANQRFGILALSKTNVRLLAATPFQWQELPLDVLPLDAQAELDSRPAAAAAAGGEAVDDVRKEILVASPRNIATAIKAAIKDDPAPVILVADPGVAGHFLQQVEIRQIQEQPLQINPFALSDQELHAKVLDVIRPVLDVDLNAVLEQVTARLGTAEPNVAIRLEEILAAGQEGRVDAVVVAEDESLWGRLNPDETVSPTARRVPGTRIC